MNRNVTKAAKKKYNDELIQNSENNFPIELEINKLMKSNGLIVSKKFEKYPFLWICFYTATKDVPRRIFVCIEKYTQKFI